MKAGMLPHAVARCLIMLASAVALGGKAKTTLGSGSAGRQNRPPTCSCDCCAVSERRPDEVLSAIVAGANVSVNVKCSPSDSHNADICPLDECQTQESDRVLGPSAAGGGGAVDYMRYCFYECKPLAGVRSPIFSQCVDLDDSDVRIVTANGADAKDPAVAVIAAVAAAARNRTSSLLASRTRVRIDPREAEVLVRNMKRQAETQAAAAKSEASEGREVEVSKAQELSSRLKARIAARKMGEPESPSMAMADIHEGMLDAEEQAQQAAQSMQDAIQSLHAGRQKAWDAAVGAGQAAMMGVKNEFQAWVDHKNWVACRLDGSCQEGADSVAATEKKMAEAAAKAAEPYHLSMLRSQESVQTYTAKAEKAASEAVAWEAKSKALTVAANADKQKGKIEFAEEKIAEAKLWMKRAKEFAAQAKHFFATADQVNKDIPKFQAAAQAAAVRAAYDQQPAWQGTRYGTNMR